jgi:hypothetical protein
MINVKYPIRSIKFILPIHKHDIRTLEELKDHFELENVYDHYVDGILEKWLDVRGYTTEYQAVHKLKQDDKLKDKRNILNALVQIFMPELVSDPKTQNIIQFIVNRNKVSINDPKKILEININDFKNDMYLLTDVHKNLDENILKDILKKLNGQHLPLLQLTINDYIEKLIDHHVLTLIYMHMYPEIVSVLQKINDPLKTKMKDKISNSISTLIQKPHPMIKVIMVNTRNQWVDFDQNKRYLILDVSNPKEIKFKSNQIEIQYEKILIRNHLSYQTNAECKIYYMELDQIV